MLVLGIETSCDETGVALYDAERGLLAQHLYSQIALHAEYGGVVPELASRDHIQKLLPLINETLDSVAVKLHDIDGIAYTAGPGLVGALLVGATVGRSLGLGLNIPTLGVNHLEAHLLAARLENPAPQFPFLALLVSGGHTLLIHVHELGQYQILGDTLDDAVGEAFDKTAKLLGLPYPGGAALAKLAEQGNPNRFHFPRPMTTKRGLDFSFSGIKTAALNIVNKHGKDEQTKADIASAFQQAVVETLIIKSMRAMKQTGLQRLVVAGGVGANHLLRQTLTAQIAEIGGEVFFPKPELCTDNGAMIAYVGYLRLSQGEHDGLAINVLPRWPLNDLTPPR